MAPAASRNSLRTTLPKFTPDDLVPRLRTDLKVTADLTAEEGVVQIEDPRLGKTHSLKEVEFSLARMLNGKRTAGQVVDAAANLGLPLGLDGLARFVGKLRALGLIVEARADALAAEPKTPVPARPPTTSTWPMRDEWGEGQRASFQAALKCYRNEQFDDALTAIDQFLAETPDAREATELRARIEKKRAAWTSGPHPRTFSEEFGALEATWFAEGDSGEWAKNQAPEEDLAAAPAAKGSKLPLFIVGGMLAAGVAALLVPFPYRVEAKVELKAQAPALNVNAPHSGTVASVEVKQGQWVEQGAVLVRFDAADAKARLAKAAGELKDKQARLKKAKAPSAKAAKAKAAMVKGDAAEKKAKADLEAARGAAKGKKSPVVAKAEKKAALAEKAALAARKAWVAAGGGDDAEQLQLEVDALEKQVAALTADAGAAEVLAAQAGRVVGLSARPGAALPKDGALLRLEDTRTLSVDLEVAARDVSTLKVGQDVPFKVGGKKYTAKLTQATADGVVATFDNAKGELQTGATGTATLSGGTRSVLGRL